MFFCWVGIDTNLKCPFRNIRSFEGRKKVKGVLRHGRGMNKEGKECCSLVSHCLPHPSKTTTTQYNDFFPVFLTWLFASYMGWGDKRWKPKDGEALGWNLKRDE